MINDENDFVLILIGYNRIEFLRRRLEEIFVLNPPFVFVSIDYSTPELAAGFKTLLEEFSLKWPRSSQFTYFIQNDNLGLVEHITSTISKQLHNYEHVIVIEDDIAISESFYNACKSYINNEYLNKKYASFSGFSIIPPKSYWENLNRYRSSPYFSCWGWVVSRQNWKGYETDLSQIDIAESLQTSLLWQKLSRKQQNTWIGRFEKIKLDQYKTWDIQFQYHSFKMDKPHLLPIFRLAENEGFLDDRSTNTKNGRPRILGSFGISKKDLTPSLSGKVVDAFLTFVESSLFVEDRKTMIRVLRAINRLGKN